MHPAHTSPVASPLAPLLPPEVTSIRVCRLCASPHLERIADFGVRYMVEFPATPFGITKPPVPLVLLQCRTCTLVQLRDTPPASWRYDTYHYRSNVNETMRAELHDVVALVRSLVPLSARSLVVDIGANDGTLLQAYATGASGATPYRIGVEPALNLFADLKPHAEDVWQTCWPALPAGAHLPSHSVVAITSLAMIYGADSLDAFVAEVARVLRSDGVWIVQFQDLLSGLRSVAVDYLVHEHLCWFSLWSFAQLCGRHGLQVTGVEQRAINGGSLRVVVRQRTGQYRALESVEAQFRREAQAGLLKAGQGWGTFLARVTLMQTALQATVRQVLASGGTIDLYAASTKASVLLQLCDLDSRHIRQAVERQPAKWGRYVGASGIPIVSEAAMRLNPPTMLLLGAYQFRDTFLQREAAYLTYGGVMLCPLPHPEIIREVRS